MPTQACAVDGANLIEEDDGIVDYAAFWRLDENIDIKAAIVYRL